MIKDDFAASRDWIVERGESLDISWIRDETNAESNGSLDPAKLAREAMSELEAVLSELREILVELGEELEE